jgi:apolipoprotein D and lipocalin family protein
MNEITPQGVSRNSATRLGALRRLLALTLLGLLASCTKIPAGLEPVKGFEIDRFLGHWYEVARLDHSFERNQIQVTADYTAREDGDIAVLNRGFNVKTGQWQEQAGVAKFVGDKDVGSLKVSFWGPFYGGYHILDLDKQDYRYALVTGPSRSFLWILSRDKTLSDAQLNELVAKAAKWGFDPKKLIFVRQEPPEPKPAESKPVEPQPSATPKENIQ